MAFPKGKKHSEKTLKKLSEYRISHPTKYWLGKENPNRIGEKSNFWKGGVKNNPNYQRDRLRKIRAAVLEALGGKCIRCGFDDKRALQIDHINGGGSKEREFKYSGREYNTKVLESFLRGENKYQLLCANCNWIKRSENDEVRKGAHFYNGLESSKEL